MDLPGENAPEENAPCFVIDSKVVLKYTFCRDTIYIRKLIWDIWMEGYHGTLFESIQ